MRLITIFILACLLLGADIYAQDDGLLCRGLHDEYCCGVIVPPTEPIRSGDPCPDHDVIDILWVYTSAALQDWGGIDGVQANCQIAIDLTNKTFANTGLPFTVQTVGIHGTQYDEPPPTNVCGECLGAIQSPDDGLMDEIHDIRDVVAADIVVLITHVGCGVAYVAPDNPSYGFHQVATGCMPDAFRHELGHNLGSKHWSNDSGGYFPWSAGHVLALGDGSEVGTAMGGNSIAHYSNPNVFYDGVATGIPAGDPGQADNFAAFTVTVPMVADFRCSREGIGACCTSGFCDMTTDADCGGKWIGYGSTCDNYDCELGACCWSDDCQLSTEVTCIDQGGSWLGEDIECGDVPCTDNDGTLYVPVEYSTIQLAVNVAADGDLILVSPGTYTSTQAGHVVDMRGKSITLRSISGPDVTVIDGQGMRRGIACVNGETPSTVIDGFTIVNGFAAYYDYDNDTYDDWWERAGGGLICKGSSPTVTGCRINNNDGNEKGGGLFIYLGNGPTLTDCTLSNNWALWDGGGFYCYASAPAILNCDFQSNVAQQYYGGGGYCHTNSNATLVDCSFTDNTAYYYGGGLFCWSSNPTLTRCVLSENSAQIGGGLNSMENSDPILASTLVCGNQNGQISGDWTDSGGNVIADKCTGGACCWGDVCTVATQDDCDLQNGEWLGEGTSCAGNPCDAASTGACCIGDNCTTTTQTDCGGDWLGEGTTCQGNPCYVPPTGACCFGNECGMLTEDDCISDNGEWLGEGTTCDGNPCYVPPTGACCIGQSCSVTTDANCGGDYLGDGTNCDGNPCYVPPTGVCCIGDNCSITTQADCNGDWLGAGTNCDGNPCYVPPTGACCIGPSCIITTDANCGGEWLGEGTDCADDPCNLGGGTEIVIAYNIVGVDLLSVDQPHYTVDVFAKMPAGWRLQAVYGSSEGQIFVASTTSFYQNAAGGPTSQSINPALYPKVPDLEWDSRVTIGCLDSSGDPFSENALNDIGIDWTNFENGGDLDVGQGTWFINPATPQGGSRPFTNSDCTQQNGVLIARLTTMEYTSEIYFSAGLQGRDANNHNSQSNVSSTITYQGEQDCNDNGLNDACDIANGTSDDTNGNGIPDECECAADIAGPGGQGFPDGIVGVNDLLAVIGYWGSSSPGGDVDGDGFVGVHDLLLVISAWGPCP